MHHFKAKGGTIFNFNSDLSGDVRLSVDTERAMHGEARIPAADLLEFVEYWQTGYVSPEERNAPLALSTLEYETERFLAALKAARASTV